MKKLKNILLELLVLSTPYILNVFTLVNNWILRKALRGFL